MDLVGGYYDAGDNVKFGLPMAFTVTTLAWSAILYRQELQSSGELQNVLNGIRWGTDYFLKASSKRNKLWVQVAPLSDQYICDDVTHSYILQRTQLMGRFGRFDHFRE